MCRYSALRKLAHPNIVGIHGVCLDNRESVSLLMELVPGGSLRARLDSHPEQLTADGDAQFAVLQGIASGMAYLHGRVPFPILHHDVRK